MQVKNKVFESYMSVRGNNLDANDDFNKHRFECLVEANYGKYFKDKNCTILEIGSYKGFTINALKKHTEDDNIYAVELSDEAAEFSKTLTGLKNIYSEDLFSFLPKHERKFDVIIMKAVFEHIDKDKAGLALELIKMSLKEGGVALISVPNMSWLMATHERYMDFTHEIGYTKESLHDVAKLYFSDVNVVPLEYDFPETFKGRLRKRLVTPIAKFIVKSIYKALSQGAYIDTMFDRSIMAVCKK